MSDGRIKAGKKAGTSYFLEKDKGEKKSFILKQTS